MPRQHDRELYNRRSLRRPDHDYAGNGIYFTTITVLERACLYGARTENGVALNDAGRMIATEWRALDERFVNVTTDIFVIMPDHIHGILTIRDSGQRQALRPTVSQLGAIGGCDSDCKPISLGRIMQAFKSITTRKYIDGVRRLGWTPFNGKVWQRNYYERIVRSREELDSIRSYIASNPSQPYDDDHIF